MSNIPLQPPTPLHGIIFDFDGVIVDSEKHWAKVENPYLRRHIPSWQDNNYAALVGRSLPEVHDYLTSRGFDVSAEEYFADYEEMAQELYRDLAQPLDQVTNLVTWAQDHEILCAIASSSKRNWIDVALRAHGLDDAFKYVISAHDPEVTRGKPAPDVYLRAVELLGISASNLIAIEDSKNGVAAAKTANLYCFGLRNGFNEDQDLTEADDILDIYGPEDITKVMSFIA